MKVPLLDLEAQCGPLRSEFREAIDRVLSSHAYCLGPEVERFEEAVREFVQPASAVGVSNGTDALVVALMALKIGPGDEVLIPAFSFFATAAAVLRVGARPVFVDVDDHTFNIDAAKAASAVTSKTRAIMPVHLYGQCADMTAIQRMAKSYGLRIVEDAAQALGATQNAQYAGSFGDLACFSFYPTKNLGAAGEAGLVTSRDPGLLERCRVIRNQGMAVRYEHQCLGGNFRMDGIQAAVLGVKLSRLRAWNERRAEIAGLYNERLANAGIRLPVLGEGNTHIYHQYTIRTPHRDGLHQHLQTRSIAAGIYYPIPLHHQPCLRQYDAAGPLTVSEACAKQVLSLPVFPELTAEQIETVVTQVRAFSTTTEHV
jgi:dTDP-4-amino-4,6-dideoxygalactose transaminase